MSAILKHVPKHPLNECQCFSITWKPLIISSFSDALQQAALFVSPRFSFQAAMTEFVKTLVSKKKKRFIDEKAGRY